jgi:Protein kinase domain
VAPSQGLVTNGHARELKRHVIMHQEDDLDRLLAEALEQPSDARKAFLESRCANDPELRILLEKWLRECDDDDPFLKAGGALEGPLWEDMLTESSELAAGARLGPFEIRSAIGAGGMGEVYRAHDGRLGRDVAIKILPSDAPASSDALARFEREARAVAALSHPNILAIHDIGVEGDVRYVVTELLEGETLRDRLASGPLPPSKAIDYGIQMAHGLAAAHSRGIIHRDVKPQNVFITNDGRVKILDFGIASFSEDIEPDADTRAGALTHSGMIPGTTGYTSPEQILGKPATARSDLFALGIVLHEMLTGVHPFARSTPPETLTAVLRDDPPTVLRTLPEIAPSVVSLVERCLEKQPGDRPETARDVALFLEIAADQVGTGGRAGHDTPATHRFRTRLLAFSCGLVVLTTAVTWGSARMLSDRSAREMLDERFTGAERSVRRLYSEQVARLGLTARLVASFPELKALFATDVATIEDFLVGYQQRIATTAALIALGPNGTTIGRANLTGPTSAASDEWLPALLAAHGDGAVVTIGKRPYIAVASSSEAGGTIFGYLVAAEPINQTFADTVSQMAQSNVVLLSKEDVLGSTLQAAETPWRSLEAWHASGGTADRSIAVPIGPRRFAAREVPLANDPPVSVIVLNTQDDVVQMFRSLETRLFLIGVVALAAAAVGSVWLSRSVTTRGRMRPPS